MITDDHPVGRIDLYIIPEGFDVVDIIKADAVGFFA
jgi:hypothetical protein